jgi:lysophospholipase L1-like esterase
MAEPSKFIAFQIAVTSALIILVLSTFMGSAFAKEVGSPTDSVWMGSWGASPAPPILDAGADPHAVTPRFEDQTLVQVMRLSAGGRKLRLRISNEYGDGPLEIGSVKVSNLNADGTDKQFRTVTFAGSLGVVVPVGAPVLSDPVDLATLPLARVRISMHVAGSALCTCHLAGGERIEFSPMAGSTSGNVRSTASADSFYRAFVTGIEVEVASPGPVIVTFGDSITDGLGSSIGTNRRWPDLLAERLAARPGPPAAVVNAGISGNRLLTDGYRAAAGESALRRFDRDVLAVSGVTHLILLEGVNDLGFGGAQPPEARHLIFAYRQIIARARAHGIRVIGGTILPYGGGVYFHSAGEAVRQAVNDWIRASGAFDAVVDFDAAMRDPANPTRLQPEFHTGDWIHPNDAGYAAMAAALDLQLFSQPGGKVGIYENRSR